MSLIVFLQDKVASEKEVVDALFEQDSSVRQAQVCGQIYQAVTHCQ